MFNRFRPRPKPLVQAPVTSEAIRPRPGAATVTLDDSELKAYERTASAIGFEPAALLEARFLRFFAERGIPVFPYSQAAAYLVAEAMRRFGADASWWWRPLRKSDAITTHRWGAVQWNGDVAIVRDYYDSADWACRPYSRAVPLRVLARVEEIAGVFGDRAKFLVTEMGVRQQYRDGKPDPFICVSALDMPRLVFDAWDEPGFTG